MTHQKTEPHKHSFEDKGKGYFVTDKIFVHDESSQTSITHEFQCECGTKKYEEVED